MINMTIAKQTEAPDFLEGVALETWNELAPMLFQLGYFEQTDVPCLAVYCECWSDWMKLQAEENPDRDILCKVMDVLLEYENALGLNPAARLKIQRNLEIVNAL